MATRVINAPIEVTHDHKGNTGDHANGCNHIVDELTGSTFSHLRFQPRSYNFVARLLFLAFRIIVVLGSIILTFIHGSLLRLLTFKCLFFVAVVTNVIFCNLLDDLIFDFLVIW